MREGTGLEPGPSHKVSKFSTTALCSQTWGDLLMPTLSSRVWSSSFLQTLNIWSHGGTMGDGGAFGRLDQVGGFRLLGAVS